MVYGLGLRAKGLGFGVWGLELRVNRVHGERHAHLVQGVGFRFRL